MREQSIDRLGKWREKRSGVEYKKGRRELGKWKAVRDSPSMLGYGAPKDW